LVFSGVSMDLHPVAEVWQVTLTVAIRIGPVIVKADEVDPRALGAVPGAGMKANGGRALRGDPHVVWRLLDRASPRVPAAACSGAVDSGCCTSAERTAATGGCQVSFPWAEGSFAHVTEVMVNGPDDVYVEGRAGCQVRG
jgi:hypothetical protein